MDLLWELFKTLHNDEIYFEDKGSALKRKGKKKERKGKTTNPRIEAENQETSNIVSLLAETEMQTHFHQQLDYTNWQTTVDWKTVWEWNRTDHIS